MKDKYIDHYGIDSLPHLIDAYHAGAEYFVTHNKGLLADRAELEQRFHIKIRTPKEMNEEGDEEQ